MKLDFPAAVRLELREAIDYYEGKRPGLGEHFWEEVALHIRWILANPEVPRLRAGGLSPGKPSFIPLLHRLRGAR